MSQVKVSQRTHDLLRVASRLSATPMTEIVDQAVLAYLASQREKIEAGIEDCKRLLGLLDGDE